MRAWTFRILIWLAIGVAVHAVWIYTSRYPVSNRAGSPPVSGLEVVRDRFFDLPDVLIFIPGVMLILLVNDIDMQRRKRIRRRREGRCPTCGYNLRSEFDDGCPECGWNRAETAR